MSYEWHGDRLEDRLGSVEIHKVLVFEVWVVAVGVVVPHVGGEVGVDVGVAEVRGEGQAEYKSAQDREPALSRALSDP